MVKKILLKKAGFLSCVVFLHFYCVPRFRAPEVLFRPDLIGEEYEGLHEVLVFAIQKSDMDLRKERRRPRWIFTQVLWIQINWNWIRILNFGTIWIRIQGCVLKKKNCFGFRGKQFSLKKYIFKTINDTGKFFCQLSRNGEFFSSILHLLPLIYYLSFFYLCGSG